MSKLIEEPIQPVLLQTIRNIRNIHAIQSDGSSRFRWRKKLFTVKEIIDHWRDTGCWWDGEGEKLFYRIETTNLGVCDIYLDQTSKRWYLYKLYD